MCLDKPNEQLCRAEMFIENDSGRYGKRSQGFRAQDQRGVGRSQHRSGAEDSGASPTSGRDAARTERGGDEVFIALVCNISSETVQTRITRSGV